MNGTVINLHEILKERETYPHGLISTFTFDAGFFESYVLDRFRVPRGCRHLTIFMDQGQYDELAENMLDSQGRGHTLANRRYLLHPISVRGVFHPKIFLFASATSGLLIIGSANLTKDGLSSNAELVSVFRFRRDKNEAALPLFQQVYAFFHALQERWPGECVAENLAGMAEYAPWLGESPPFPPLEPMPPVILHNLNEPLWNQLTARFPGTVKEFWAVSRFFDESPVSLDRFMVPLGTPLLKIYTAGAIHSMSPSWLDHPLARERRMEIRFCQYGSTLQPQRLHGKAYAFLGNDWGALAFGSANFSSPALLQSSHAGNVEMLLLYHHGSGREMRQAISHLFDPTGNGRLITHASQFGPMENAGDEPVNCTQSCLVRIMESWLEDEVLSIRFASTPPPHARFLLYQSNQGSFPLDLPSGEDELVRITLPDDALRRLRTRPTIVRLVDSATDTPLSNPVIIAALLDEAAIQETRSQRKAREAVESPARFMAILHELCVGDERRLIDHLSRCDIAIVQNIHLLTTQKDGKSGGGKGRGTRDGYGDRAFRQFEILHEAVMDFCRRHRRRLEIHVEEGTVSGVGNYFHILETLLLLLHSQVERATTGLELRKAPITSTRWKDARTNLTTYYDEIAALLKLTAHEYVRRLNQSSSDVIVRERFGKNPEEILRICSDTLKLQIRLLQLQHGPLRILTGHDSELVPIHFMKTRISKENWPNYVKSVQAVSKDLRQWIPGEHTDQAV